MGTIDIIIENLPVFLVIIPFIVAFIIPTFSKRVGLVEGVVLSAETLWFLSAALLAGLVLLVNKQPIVYNMGGWEAPWGIELIADNLSAFFILIVTGISFPIALFGKDNLKKEIGADKKITRFYVLLLLLGGSLVGMVLTNDLFNTYVLVEVSTLSACALVSVRDDSKSTVAAFKYLVLASLGSTFILGGIGFIYMATGYLNMGFAHQELLSVWQNSPNLIWLSIVFMLIGFGVKAALFPLHTWLPDAHSSAPTPSSAILSGLAVKGYIISFMKILYTVYGQNIIQQFNIHKILVLLGMVAIIGGSLFALTQDELKRRLAYSTVGQVGYLFLGLGLLNINGLTGTLFYLGSHAAIKSSLFLSAGAMIEATGETKVSGMKGIGRKMPVTMAVFTIGSLGLIGIPLFSGFVGKWYLLLGSLDSGNFLPVVAIMIGSVLCAAYLLPIIRTAYFDRGKDSQEEVKDPPFPQKISLLILGAVIIILGVLPGPILELASRAARDLLMVQ